jgi:hypothetical protein
MADQEETPQNQDNNDMEVEDMEDDSALPPPPSQVNEGILPPPVAEFEKHWDPVHESWYFMSTSTGERFESCTCVMRNCFHVIDILFKQ